MSRQVKIAWQPFATAPQDGSVVLIAFPHYGGNICIAGAYLRRWTGHKWIQIDDDTQKMQAFPRSAWCLSGTTSEPPYPPTHWAPFEPELFP